MSRCRRIESTARLIRLRYSQVLRPSTSPDTGFLEVWLLSQALDPDAASRLEWQPDLSCSSHSPRAACDSLFSTSLAWLARTPCKRSNERHQGSLLQSARQSLIHSVPALQLEEQTSRLQALECHCRRNVCSVQLGSTHGAARWSSASALGTHLAVCGSISILRAGVGAANAVPVVLAAANRADAGLVARQRAAVLGNARAARHGRQVESLCLAVAWAV
jgi:hypothetical protein